MYSKVCLCLLLAVAMVQSLPAGEVEKISESSPISPKELEDLNLEGSNDENERMKKQASFLLQIRPSSENGQQASQDGCQGQVQSLSVVQQSPVVPQLQTYNVQPAPQPMQAMGIFQAAPAFMVPQQSFMVPQQVVPQQQMVQQQVVPSIHIIQPQQPCAQEQKVQVIEKTVEVPAPTPAPEVVTVKPQPERMVVETVKLVPVPPVCKDKLVVVPSKPMVVVPEPTVVKVPHCTHEGFSEDSQCNCNQHAMMRAAAMGGPVDPMHMMAMKGRHMHMPMPLMRSNGHQFAKPLKA